MIVMVLSDLEKTGRCYGGVDMVCQTQLKWVKDNGDGRTQFRVVAFNPGNDSTRSEVPSPNSDLDLYQYNEKRNDGIWRYLPNVVWQNFIIQHHLQKFRPDLVHTHLPGWLILPAQRTARVFTYHSQPKLDRASLGKLNSWIFQTVLPELQNRLCDRVIVISAELCEDLQARGLSNIETVPNAVSSAYFDVEVRSRDTKVAPRFCMVGALSTHKRVHVGIQAASRLGGTQMRSKLSVIGPGSHEAYVNQLKVEEASAAMADVEFLGRCSIPEIARIFTNSSCGLFLSSSETFGIAPLEMLAASLPLITTPVGVMKTEREVFEQCGVRYVEVDDVEGTARAMQSVLSNPPVLEQRLRARDYVAQRYSVAATMGLYGKIYDEVLSERRHKC